MAHNRWRFSCRTDRGPRLQPVLCRAEMIKEAMEKTELPVFRASALSPECLARRVGRQTVKMSQRPPRCGPPRQEIIDTVERGRHYRR